MLNSPSNSQNRNEGGVNFHLPDEIAEEILSRLPAMDVVRFRSVCKKWRDLTSTQRFTLLHLKRCRTPMLAFEEYVGDPSEFYLSKHYLLDQWWGPLQTTPEHNYKFGNLSEFNLVFSNGGLFVMLDHPHRTYMIMNPMFPEKVQITFPKELIDDIWGVYFHPLLKEYCTLWRIIVSGVFNSSSVETSIYENRILSLGSEPCWRKISNPGNHLFRVGGIAPVLIDEQLYWLVDSKLDHGLRYPPDILEFDIRKEEFTLIPSAASRADKWGWHGCNSSLLDVGGLLSLVLAPLEVPPTTRQFEVKVWTLKDRSRQVWTMSSYSIDGDAHSNSKPIALVNDELALHCGSLLICNLKLCTVKEIEDYYCRADDYSRSHVMSLLSLRNCKSEIYMDERGEVEKNK